MTASQASQEGYHEVSKQSNCMVPKGEEMSQHGNTLYCTRSFWECALQLLYTTKIDSPNFVAYEPFNTRRVGLFSDGWVFLTDCWVLVAYGWSWLLTVEFGLVFFSYS